MESNYSRGFITLQCSLLAMTLANTQTLNITLCSISRSSGNFHNTVHTTGDRNQTSHVPTGAKLEPDWTKGKCQAGWFNCICYATKYFIVKPMCKCSIDIFPLKGWQPCHNVEFTTFQCIITFLPALPGTSRPAASFTCVTDGWTKLMKHAYVRTLQSTTLQHWSNASFPGIISFFTHTQTQTHTCQHHRKSPAVFSPDSSGK